MPANILDDDGGTTEPVAGEGATGTTVVTVARAGGSVSLVSATAKYGSVTIGNTPGLSLTLSNHADTCTAISGKGETAGATFAIPGSPLSPGAFSVVSSDYVNHALPKTGEASCAVYSITDCKGTGVDDNAASGTLTITAVDATHIAGSVDVKLEDGTLSGSFDAPLCDSDASPTSDCVP